MNRTSMFREIGLRNDDNRIRDLMQRFQLRESPQPNAENGGDD